MSFSDILTVWEKFPTELKEEIIFHLPIHDVFVIYMTLCKQVGRNEDFHLTKILFGHAFFSRYQDENYDIGNIGEFGTRDDICYTKFLDDFNAQTCWKNIISRGDIALITKSEPHIFDLFWDEKEYARHDAMHSDQ